MEFFRNISPKDQPTGPDTVIEFDMSEAESYNWHGLIAGKEELDYQGAIKNFNEAIRLDPEYAIAYSNRGIAYSKMGEYQQAINDYNHAIKLYPNYAKAYFNRAFTYSKLKNYQQAIADYTMAIQLNPTDANAYVLRGVIYSTLGNREKACEDQKKACELGICEGLNLAREKGICT
jgi:tetratricopeptide (TPR) repeat protein